MTTWQKFSWAMNAGFGLYTLVLIADYFWISRTVDSGVTAIIFLIMYSHLMRNK